MILRARYLDILRIYRNVQRDERVYVQVCRRLPEELAVGNVNGVKIMHLADFLLCKNY